VVVRAGAAGCSVPPRDGVEDGAVMVREREGAEGVIRTGARAGALGCIGRVKVEVPGVDRVLPPSALREGAVTPRAGTDPTADLPLDGDGPDTKDRDGVCVTPG
ncbi:MAG: hypothetical protein KDM81_21465, partial [Verrucomicrobiae bacterium]|nr:hypothetical protein [Verrucomicrobiae bacterium]